MESVTTAGLILHVNQPKEWVQTEINAFKPWCELPIEKIAASTKVSQSHEQSQSHNMPDLAQGFGFLMPVWPKKQGTESFVDAVTAEYNLKKYSAHLKQISY